MTLRPTDTLPDPVEADFSIAADHPSLPGHFPGQPVVPGVLVLDRVLAAAEALLGETPPTLHMPQVKFVRPLLPEQPARLRLEPALAVDGGLRLKFRVSLSGTDAAAPGDTIATGELVPGAAA